MNPYDDTRPQLKLVGGTDYEKNKLNISPKHRGVGFTRALKGQHPQENTRQLIMGFSEEWSKMGEENFLEKLLCTGEVDPRQEFIPRDTREWEVAHLVAATIVQWLPTTIGCSFLKKGFQRGGGDFKYRLPDYEQFCS